MRGRYWAESPKPVTGWLLILMLLVLGGVLSTLGDRLGSRVGKARLSLFNLRPRHTAVVITVLTGSLISAVSLGLMLLVSQRLRTGLFELDQLEDRLRQSREQLAGSRSQLENSQTQLQASQKNLQASRVALQSSKTQVARAQEGLLQIDRKKITVFDPIALAKRFS